jgi:hypothetical protein
MEVLSLVGAAIRKRAEGAKLAAEQADLFGGNTENP